MIIAIQIFLIIFAITFTFLRYVKGAQIEFSFGLACMFGTALEAEDVLIKNVLFRHWTCVFFFGPISIAFDWFQNIKNKDDEWIQFS